MELLKEFHSIKSNKISLTIAGFSEGSIYEEKVINESKKDSRINLIDYVDNVPKLIISHDINICPFTEPHFSRAIVEAPILKMPSISRDIASPNEIIKHGINGWLYRSNDELEKIISDLIINNKLINIAGKEAFKFASEKFNSETNSKETLEFLLSKA